MDALTLLEENKQLKRLVKDFLDDTSQYISSEDGFGDLLFEHSLYKKLDELLKQDVELPTTDEVVERLTT